MTWTDDGWPLVGNDGGTELDFPDVDLPSGDPRDVPETLWTQGWLGIGATPDQAALGDDHSISVPGGADLDAASGAGALLRPQTSDDSRFAATLASPPVAGAAGIAVHTDARHHFSVLLSGDADARMATVGTTVDDLTSTRQMPLPGTGPVTLEILARPDSYTATASVGGRVYPLGQCSARLLSAEAAEWFVAAHFALLHLGAADRAVRFTDLEQHDLPPRPHELQLPF